MKFKKLDGRFSGYKNFRYCVQFYSKEIELFCQIRNWCWDQWGPSTELDSWYKIPQPNAAWCWQCDTYNTRIYFNSDKEYQWFILKWR